MKTEKKQKTEIPDEWEEASLGDVCEMERGYSYRSSEITKTDKANREFITIDNFSKEGGLKNGAETIYLKDNVEINDTYFIKKNDILIANTDMTKGFIIGAPVIMDPQNKKLVYSMDLTKLKKLRQARHDADHSTAKCSVETHVSVSTIDRVEMNNYIPKSDFIRKSLIKYIDKHLKQSKKGK